MFDLFVPFFEKITSNLSWDVVLLVLLIGFGQGKFITKKWNQNGQVDGAWKTAAISIVLIPLYVYMLKGEGQVLAGSKAFFSFIFATSLYEIVIKVFLKALEDKSNAVKP
jgi:hypothetical protein